MAVAPRVAELQLEACPLQRMPGARCHRRKSECRLPMELQGQVPQKMRWVSWPLWH